LCKDLIGSLTLTEHFWLLVTGTRPTAAQTRILDACLVAISEHGLVPSVQGAVTAGILGCGSVILGSAENAGKFLARLCERADAGDLAAAASALVQEFRAARQPF